MKNCPNCNYMLQEPVPLCPHCGQDVGTLWNAPASGSVQAQFAEINASLGQRAKRDRINTVIGFLLGLGLSCLIPLFLLGNILSLILFFVFRNREPGLSRGLGWGTFTGFFGAIFVCARGIMMGIGR